MWPELNPLKQIYFVCPGNSFRAVTDVHLAVGIRDMTFDGGQDDEQMLCDLLVPHSCRNETQDVDFPQRQRLCKISRRGLGGFGFRPDTCLPQQVG